MVSPGFTRGYSHLLPPGATTGRHRLAELQRRGAPTRINGILTNLMEAELRTGSGR
jgi:hypothetical protein